MQFEPLDRLTLYPRLHAGLLPASGDPVFLFYKLSEKIFLLLSHFFVYKNAEVQVGLNVLRVGSRYTKCWA
jgi:hypothetical protein